MIKSVTELNPAFLEWEVRLHPDVDPSALTIDTARLNQVKTAGRFGTLKFMSEVGARSETEVGIGDAYGFNPLAGSVRSKQASLASATLDTGSIPPQVAVNYGYVGVTIGLNLNELGAVVADGRNVLPGISNADAWASAVASGFYMGLRDAAWKRFGGQGTVMTSIAVDLFGLVGLEQLALDKNPTLLGIYSAAYAGDVAIQAIMAKRHGFRPVRDRLWSVFPPSTVQWGLGRKIGRLLNKPGIMQYKGQPLPLHLPTK